MFLIVSGGLAFQGEDVFGDWQIWVFVLGMGTLAFLQLVILNQGLCVVAAAMYRLRNDVCLSNCRCHDANFLGLARFPALVFVPSYTVLYIVMGTGVGLVFYKEYTQLDALRWGMYVSWPLGEWCYWNTVLFVGSGMSWTNALKVKLKQLTVVCV